MSVKLKMHSGDSDMVEIYTMRKPKVDVACFNREFMILWGVVHVDMLSELGIDVEALEAGEVELAIKQSPCERI